MRLKDWMRAEGLSVWEFSELIESSPTSVRRYSDGEGFPRYETLVRIVEATEGAVTPNDLFATCQEFEQAQRDMEP